MRPSPHAEKRTFRIFGMDCAEEVVLLRREVSPLVGGDDRLSFDILAGKMIVSGPDIAVTDREIVAAIAQTGLRAEPWSDERSEHDIQRRQFARLRSVLVVVSGMAATGGFLAHVWIAGDLTSALGSEGMGAAEGVPIASRILYGLGVVAGTWMVLPTAMLAARRLRPDINLLMTIAVVGAIGLGEWFEAATVAFLFAFSALLESWSIGRARKAIASLLDLAPPTARIKADGGQELAVALTDVKVGQAFIVRPGERIPLDGRVAVGMSDVNQAPITGESKPTDKSPGDTVFAGTINGNGALEVIATASANDTTLARIIQMVEEAQTRRAPSEQWVESFSRIYTPVVMAIAALVLIIPPLLFAHPWTASIYNALVLLVIACPCALVISTPVSIVAGLTAAARRGVLIKGGVFLEIPGQLNSMAFDKTGTLTRGRPAVVEVVPMNGHNSTELLERAAALEVRSDHPLAHAVITYAERQGITALPAENLQTLQGKGLAATINGRPFWLGSHRYLEDRGQETPEIHNQLEQLSKDGHSVLVIGNEEHVCGFLGLADQVRPEAKAALRELRSLGIRHLVMLTGDNQSTANAIAAEVGVDEVHAELLPHDKVEAIRGLVDKYTRVAMLGDGINDAPALAQATVGIAMGAVGSDAALESADITLMADDLSQLPWLLRHSRRTLAIIRQNITFSLVIKAVFVLLTFVGWASLWAAIAADMGASLLVTANGLRLLRSPLTSR